MYIEPKATSVALPVTVDVNVPGETRLFLYMAAGYLRRLAAALHDEGVSAWYARPGVRGVVLPRVYVIHPEHGEMDAVVGVSGGQVLGPNAEWWFEWWQWWRGSREPICRTSDIPRAAWIIARQLATGGACDG